MIVQVGNLEDCGATTPEGEKAAQILEQYMSTFQERNPKLQVFSAHLHMDEATPHLHIDFVPFITDSKRGLDTRVSLKRALTAQGFSGGTRGATEWNQWVQAEKESLAEVMQEHGIQWEQKGTHNKQLTVMVYKKQEHIREVEELTAEIQEKKTKIRAVDAVEVKPAMLDKGKLVVDKSNYEDLKTLAKKHIVAERKESSLRKENATLKQENVQLRAENTALRSVRDRLTLEKLKQDYDKLKKKLDAVMKFIDKFDLREQLEQSHIKKESEIHVMKDRIFDESNGLWYTLAEDGRYYPDLVMPPPMANL